MYQAWNEWLTIKGPGNSEWNGAQRLEIAP
jgi:hypothetical protein